VLIIVVLSKTTEQLIQKILKHLEIPKKLKNAISILSLSQSDRKSINPWIPKPLEN
jgi:hypothetical protein